MAVLGLLVALVLPQVKMRGIAQQAARGPGEGFAVPEGQDPGTQLETLVGRVMARNRHAGADVLARSGLDIDLPTAWGLLGIHLRARLLDEPTSQADIEDRVGVPHGVLTSFYDEIAAEGLLRRDGEGLLLTPAGADNVSRLTQAWRDWLVDQLHEWLPGQDQADLAQQVLPAFGRIARRLMLQQERERSSG